MSEIDLNKIIVTELQKYTELLESSFHNAVNIDFAVENGVLYTLGANIEKRTATANLKIIMSMFCEGKMNIDDVIKNIPFKELEELLDTEILINKNKLIKIAVGLPASPGIAVCRVAFSFDEAINFINKEQNFIYFRIL